MLNKTEQVITSEGDIPVTHDLSMIKAGHIENTNFEARLLKTKITTYLNYFDYQEIFMYQTELGQWLKKLENLDTEGQKLLAKQQIYLRCLLALSQGKGDNNSDIVKFMNYISQCHSNKTSLDKNEEQILEVISSHSVMSSCKRDINCLSSTKMILIANNVDRCLAVFKKEIEHNNHHPEAKNAALILHKELMFLRQKWITSYCTDKEKQCFVDEANKALKRAKPGLQYGLSLWEYLENIFAHIRSFFADPRQYYLSQQSIFKMHTTLLRQSADQLSKALNTQLNDSGLQSDPGLII